MGSPKVGEEGSKKPRSRRASDKIYETGFWNWQSRFSDFSCTCVALASQLAPRYTIHVELSTAILQYLNSQGGRRDVLCTGSSLQDTKKSAIRRPPTRIYGLAASSSLSTVSSRQLLGRGERKHLLGKGEQAGK